MIFNSDTKGYVVERAILRNPSISMQDLVRKTDLNRREVVRALLALENEGLLEREVIRGSAHFSIEE